MIQSVLKYVRPRVGRLTEAELEAFGRLYQPCGFFAVGPLVVFVDLPARFQKHDEPLPIEDLNAAAARFGEELGRRLAEMTRNGPHLI